MDLFGKKKRKELEEQQQREANELAKKEKEMQVKYNIRKTLNGMKTQVKKLENCQKEYIEKARSAALINNKQTYNLAKQGLKMCISKQRYLESMIGNFEMALQMKEMNTIINEFITGMNTISEDLKGITSTVDIVKAQAAYDKAIQNNEGQYEALDAFLKEAESSIETFNGNDVDITDDEIDKLINNQVIDSESKIDDEIDQKINALKQKMNN